MLVCYYQRKGQDLVLVPPYRFGETMTLSTARHLLRYINGVLNLPLDWHLLVWEALGKDEPKRGLRCMLKV